MVLEKAPWPPVIVFLKLDDMYSGYFDPANDVFGNRSNYFQGDLTNSDYNIFTADCLRPPKR